ncbi:hypothetical protein QQ045_023203 [Rhodiola kirilowii]
MNFVQNQSISKIRFYRPNAEAMEALRGSQVSVTVGVDNGDLQQLAQSAKAAKSWVEQNIIPYAIEVVISYIILGDNVIPGKISEFVLDAMVNLRAVCNDFGIDTVKITTAVDRSVLVPFYYPSHSVFNKESTDYMIPIVKFFSSQKSPLMINIFPDQLYSEHRFNYTLDFATFSTKLPVFYDNTLGYKNLFEVMVDSFYWAMEKITDGGDVDVAITSGWSWCGPLPFSSKENSYNYNFNYMEQVSVGGGTPKKANTSSLDAFVSQMFKENDCPNITCYGLFEYNLQPVYPLFAIASPPPLY